MTDTKIKSIWGGGWDGIYKDLNERQNQIKSAAIRNLENVQIITDA